MPFREASYEFFSSLCYAESNEHFSNGEVVQNSYPVFNKLELENEPLKWLKYLLLARLGLRSIRKLSDDIHRYNYDDWHLAKRECFELIIKSHLLQAHILIVVKLVPMLQAGQLPNFHITSEDDINVVFDRLHSARRPEHVEVWVCQSMIDVKNTNFAGRLSFPTSKHYGVTWLEVVWNTSPRLLESIVHQETFAYPYLRANRQVGKMCFDVNKLFIPNKYKVEFGKGATSFIKDFLWLKSQFKRYAEKIAILENILASQGAREISLEFKVDNNRFQFIDWDTEIETSGNFIRF